jgi:predicted aspartyl protease
LLKDFGKTFRGSERKALEDDAATNRLLKDAPPQQVELTGGFTLPTHRSPIGTIDTDLAVNGISKSWILDTGANFSVLTETAARQMGLKLSEGTAQTQGATGAENPLHVALIPEMKIGSAVVRNAVVLVLKDSAIAIPMKDGSYQIEAILGFPVLSALGQLTFTADNHLRVGTGGDSSGAVMYMQQLDPLLQVRISGRELLMFFDTGASSTTFSSRYYLAFRDHFTSQTKIRHRMGGAGGVKSFTAYQEPKVEIRIGDQTATLKDVPVLMEARGTDHDLLYGSLGRDVTQSFKSFTLDFRAMRFRLEK